MDESVHNGHSVAHPMRIAIIGGGAAGLMAAASALETDPSAEIVLIERNTELGKKVIISGGGRCNVTTGITDIRELMKRYPRGAKFLTSAMHQFPPASVYEWFEAHGVPLKVEADLRVFPQSDDGHEVVGAFVKIFRDLPNLRIVLNRAVTGVKKVGEEFSVSFHEGAPLMADRVILTTGGQAYRHTGSTGDGYAFAESLGHSLTPLAPSLNSFFTKETWTKEISGVSWESAKISAGDKSWTGPFLFTHKGVSGPAVFALSGLVAFATYGPDAPMPVTINLYPEESTDDVHKQLETAFRENGKKAARTVLAAFVPKSMADVICKELALGDLNAGDLNKVQTRALATWLTGIPLNVIGRGAGDEFVTAGGVSLAEVNPSTMESKLCPGLFFAGELLDVDGFTGGFNLQASWATGRLAGASAAL